MVIETDCSFSLGYTQTQLDVFLHKNDPLADVLSVYVNFEADGRGNEDDESTQSCVSDLKFK